MCAQMANKISTHCPRPSLVELSRASPPRDRSRKLHEFCPSLCCRAFPRDPLALLFFGCGGLPMEDLQSMQAESCPLRPGVGQTWAISAGDGPIWLTLAWRRGAALRAASPSSAGYDTWLAPAPPPATTCGAALPLKAIPDVPKLGVFRPKLVLVRPPGALGGAMAKHLHAFCHALHVSGTPEFSFWERRGEGRTRPMTPPIHLVHMKGHDRCGQSSSPC